MCWGGLCALTLTSLRSSKVLSSLTKNVSRLRVTVTPSGSPGTKMVTVPSLLQVLSSGCSVLCRGSDHQQALPCLMPFDTAMVTVRYLDLHACHHIQEALQEVWLQGFKVCVGAGGKAIQVFLEVLLLLP